MAKDQTELASIRFDSVEPTVFQLGDIVEVQVSFVALPMRDNKARVCMILRSISLLEKEFTQVRERNIRWRETLTEKGSQDSMVKKITGTMQVQKGTLKRKVGYADEHVSATRAKLSNMDIDEEAGEPSRSADAATRGTTM